MKTVYEFLTEKIAEKQVKSIRTTKRVMSVLVNEIETIEGYTLSCTDTRFRGVPITVVDNDDTVISLFCKDADHHYELTENGIEFKTSVTKPDVKGLFDGLLDSLKAENLHLQLDELADICEYWKKHRENGRTPHGVKAGILALVSNINE